MRDYFLIDWLILNFSVTIHSKGSNDTDNIDIPPQIDARTLQAAKTAVTEPPAKISYLRKHWEIPASAAATIMLTTLIFLNTKDNLPTTLDESLFSGTISFEAEQKEFPSMIKDSRNIAKPVELQIPLAEDSLRAETDISASTNTTSQIAVKPITKKK